MLKNGLKLALGMTAFIGTPFAQEQAYIPGEMVKTDQMTGLYNASATYQTFTDWDVLITADYIYWMWQQDSLEIADLASNVLYPYPGSFGSTEVIVQDPGYSSGFQVAAGFKIPGMDDWSLHTEYTWYKNRDTTSVTTGRGMVFRLPWTTILSDSSVLSNLRGTLSSTVEMKLDALNFLVKRPFYLGKKLTANIATGLKALWITQTYDTSTTGFGGTNVNISLTRSAHAKQTSWGLGPKFGFETNWMFGLGVQMIANLSVSTLYTRYNLTNSGEARIGAENASFSNQLLDNYNCLRPVTEAFLGLGWNKGYLENKFRIGCSAGYNFDVYWNYSMLDFSQSGMAGAMYLQGLNAQLRVDF